MKYTEHQRNSFAHLRILKANIAKTLKDMRLAKKQKDHYLRFEYRVMHIAQCLLRGTPLTKIENNRTSDEFVKDDTYMFSRITTLMEKIKLGIFHADQTCLYVLVDSTLAPGHKTAQVSHAVATHILSNGSWRNERIVVCETCPDSLTEELDECKMNNIKTWEWYEPDLQNRLTAFCVFGQPGFAVSRKWKTLA